MAGSEPSSDDRADGERGYSERRLALLAYE